MPYEGEVNEVELMRQQLTDHQRVIEEHDERIKSLEESVEDITDKQRQHSADIAESKANYLKLENVTYSQHKETRDMFQATTDRLFDLMKDMTGNKQASAALEYDYRKAQLDVTDKKSARFWEWFGKAAGAGGVIALVVAALLQLLGQ